MRIALRVLGAFGMFVAVLLGASGVASADYQTAPTNVVQLPFIWNGKNGAKVIAMCKNGNVVVEGDHLGTGKYTATTGKTTKRQALVPTNGGSFTAKLKVKAGATSTHTIEASAWNGGGQWRIDVRNCMVNKMASSWKNAIGAQINVECSMFDGQYLMKFTGSKLGSGTADISPLGLRMGAVIPLENGAFEASTMARSGGTILFGLDASNWNLAGPWKIAVRNCELVKAKAYTVNGDNPASVTFVCFSVGNGQWGIGFAGNGVGTGTYGHVDPTNGSSGSAPVNPDLGGSFEMTSNHNVSTVSFWLQASNWNVGLKQTYNVEVGACTISSP